MEQLVETVRTDGVSHKAARAGPPGAKHGAMVGLGHLVGRWGSRLKDTSTSTNVLKMCHNTLNSELNPATVVNVLGACNAIGLIGYFRPLPLPDAKSEGELSKVELAEALAKAMKSKEIKVVEQAALCAGALMLGDPCGVMRSPLLEALYGLGEHKHEELHFSVGEALVCATSSKHSLAYMLHRTVVSLPAADIDREVSIAGCISFRSLCPSAIKPQIKSYNVDSRLGTLVTVHG